MKIERRYKFIRTLPPRAPVRTAEWLCRRIGPTALSVVRRFERINPEMTSIFETAYTREF